MSPSLQKKKKGKNNCSGNSEIFRAASLVSKGEAIVLVPTGQTASRVELPRALGAGAPVPELWRWNYAAMGPEGRTATPVGLADRALSKSGSLQTLRANELYLAWDPDFFL